MGAKIFLTGATGYIGGSVLEALASRKVYELNLLVRDDKRAEPIKLHYPKAKFVYGTPNDAKVIEKAAAEADAVIHTADSSDSVAGAEAINRGIAAGQSVEKPGYWIHYSGSAILTWYGMQHKRYGEAPLPEQKYHDIDDIQRLVTLPDDAPHRNVDKIVQAANSDAVKIAIVCPPTIYGTGAGPLNTRSIQVPEMVVNTLNKGFAPAVSPGLTEWDHLHIYDLGDLFAKLVEASQHREMKDDLEIFGLNEYFFAEPGSYKWSDVARWIAEEATK